MVKKLITFKQNEYQKVLNQSTSKLEAWKKVIEQIKTVITLPVEKEQYNLLLENPLEYVKNSIDAKHRPNINIPISTDKLIEILEIDLSSVEIAITEYDKFNGQLEWVNNEVSAIVDKEKFRVYAETKKELQKLDSSNKLIEAFNEFMKIENPKFPVHENKKQHELKQAVNNRINWENGLLVPNDYWIKES